MTASATLFLTGLTIKDFRGYGNFRLELPALPCVVLLSGPNGLGKTSFFEALEWGLTGSVKRLDIVSRSRANPLDLARRADDVDFFRVELSFRDAEGREERVTRTQLISTSGSSPEAVGTTIAAVAELLRTGESRWNVTGKNIADYLHLTHFHAQVAFLRLVTFNAKERWVRVSPLAGADRFEGVRTNLINSKAALTKLKERRAQELKDAKEARQRWSDLLDRVVHLQKLAGAARDILDPNGVDEKIGELRTRLGLEPASSFLSGERDIGGASEAVSVLRQEIEQVMREDERRLELIGRLRVLPRQWVDARAQLTAAITRRDLLEREVVEFKARAEGLARTTQDRRAGYAKAQKVHEHASEFHEMVIGALHDREDLQRLKEELANAEEQLASTNRALEESEVELRRRQEDLADHERLLRDRDHLLQQLDGIQRADKSLLEMEMLQKRITVEEEIRLSLMEALRGTALAVATIAEDIKVSEEGLAIATRELTDLQRTSAALQGALVAIAEHIRPEDTTCPVCRTEFDPGQLSVLVRVSIGTLDPILAKAESQVMVARKRRTELGKREAQIDQERRKLEADLRAVNETVDQMLYRVGTLNKDPLLAGLGPDEARAHLTRARDERRADLQRNELELEKSHGAEQLRLAVVNGGAKVDAQRRASSLANERRNVRQARHAEVQARIARLQKEHKELLGSTESIELIIRNAALNASEAKAVAETSSISFTEAQAAEAAAQQTLLTVNEDLAKTRAQAALFEEVLEDLDRQWRGAALSEQISETALDGQIETLRYRRRELDGGLGESAKIAAALERWQQAADLQEMEREIRKESGSLDRDAHTQVLDATVERARSAASVAQRARDAADELADTLGRVTAEFGERALKPFDELFQRYLRALIHDERFHNIEATYESAARSAGLRFKVELGGFGTEAEYILSEGQLGEVSLAAMLAANSTFPWSRWRALLLDDPTQYNDLIHATALFDVLRNLVRFARHQIVVSTHDNEQAGFFRRKLDSMRIPWIDCRYIAHSAEGIVAEIRNSAEVDDFNMTATS